MFSSKKRFLLNNPPPPSFANPSLYIHVFQLSKALYRLKQAPKAWYERLRNFLPKNNFKRGNIDTTLFVEKYNWYLLIVQTYVAEIIFWSLNISFYENFPNVMKGEFEKSLIGELTFFLRLQIKQTNQGIFIFQSDQAQGTPPLKRIKRSLSNVKPNLG